MATISKRFLNRPSSFKTHQDGAVVEIKNCCPFFETSCFTVICHESCSSSVNGLLCSGSPPAILFRIALSSVYAINRICWLAFSHIIQKIMKRQPASAHRDSTSSICFVRGSRFCQAPTENVLPNLVCARPVRSAPCMSMGGGSCDNRITMPASARFGIPASKSFSAYNHYISARTLAMPHSFIWLLKRAFSNNHEASKYFSDHWQFVSWNHA